MNLELKVIPPIQLIISSGLMYTLAIYFPNYNYYLNTSLAITILLIICAAFIGLWALYDFHKHKTTFHPHKPEKTSSLVDSGVFSLSRNPMYVALAMVLLAVGVFLQNYFSFFVIPLFIWYLTKYQIIPEEKMLNILFPQDYKAYCKKVNRWF